MCRAKQWESSVDDASTIRLQFNLWRHDKRLVDFVINVQVITSAGWQSVERFDCCHGHCHLHVDNDETTPRSILRLENVDDVARAFTTSQQLADKRARIIRNKGGRST